ncbi:hypothetical protein M885DRAFT_406880, partial [Pelagophyceae sp. CCMP2097]
GWDARYLRLAQYKETEGDCRVPRKFVTKDGIKLGPWVTLMRWHYSVGKLCSFRTAMLNALGFVWKTNEGWDNMFKALCAYREEFGHCIMPEAYYITPAGKKLGRWVTAQRRAFYTFRLPEERKARLDSVGFVWTALTDGWELKFDALKTYVEDKGDVLVDITYVTADGVKLGRWVRAQRKAFSKGLLLPGRVEKLEALGFAFSARFGLDQNLNALEKYKADFGDCLVPFGYLTADGAKLGKWVDKQRRTYISGHMHDLKVARLDKAGFVW